MEMDKQARILFIDDEEIVLDSCTEILAGGDYDISTAGDGTQGLAVFETLHPDLVFVDLKMPGISGFEVLDRIQSCDPTVVSVVITGFATVSSAVEAMKKGAYDFLPKPFTPDELRLIVRRGLEKRRLVLETIRLRNEKEILRKHFAAIVSHELKSPLGTLQQNLYALAADLDPDLSDEQKARLSRLQGRIRDLIDLVNTWLKTISVDLSGIRENFVPLAIPTILGRALENVEMHAVRKNITLETDLDQILHLVDGNEMTLVEAFTNVIGNAVKYTHMGGRVCVSAREENNEVVVAVQDNGIGIAAEDIPNVFEDFYVGRNRPQGEISSGVGLAITRRIIEAHAGKIGVESSPGRGSTFTIRLPLNKTASAYSALFDPEWAQHEGETNGTAKTAADR